MSNRYQKQMQVASIREQYKGAPWLNDEKFFDKTCLLADEDPDYFKLDESEIMMQQAQQINPEGMPEGMPPGLPQGMPEVPQEPQVDLTGQPFNQ